MPAILALVNIKAPAGDGWLTGFMDRLGGAVVTHSRKLFWIAGCAILLLSAGMTRITLDDNFLHYFSDRFEVRQHTDFIEQRLTGMNMIEFSLPAGSEGGVSDPQYLANVDRFSDWLREQPPEHVAQTAIYACGPTPMLKAAAALATEFELPSQLCLEEFMACAVGGCAGCVVGVREKTDAGTSVAMRRVCVDGPVFDGAAVVWA